LTPRHQDVCLHHHRLIGLVLTSDLVNL